MQNSAKRLTSSFDDFTESISNILETTFISVVRDRTIGRSFLYLYCLGAVSYTKTYNIWIAYLP